VIDEKARMTVEAGRFAGLDRFEARKQVVAELEKLGLLEKIEPHKLSISKCHRCRTIVEPLVSTQWWVKIKPLADPAIEAVTSAPKSIEFVPEVWEKTYLNWMENIRDWCISRQLWWGHRIPAWHCADCKKITVARETPTACEHCGSVSITQETDVLDTWFSSGLWPISTLGWPDHTPDLRAFYPTTLLVTGFDIIFFWAARMIMLCTEMMKDDLGPGVELKDLIPFREVNIHGLVRDAERQKMSKTKGNTVDPLVINEKYGTDAVRFALLMSAAPGGDIALSEDRIASCRNFANKIWNASRLLFSKSSEGTGEPVSLADHWIESRFNACASVANPSFQEHRYHEAAQALWHFFWDDFCDWYLELKKPEADWSYAYIVHEKALRLLHPLMPFITEELWQRLGKVGKSIALEPYPQAGEIHHQSEREMTVLQEIVTAARALRADHKVDKKPLLTGVLYCKQHLQIEAIERLANVKLTVEAGSVPKLEGAVRSSPDFDLVLEMPKAANQRERLLKENIELEKVIANSDRQLNNEEIIGKMPEKVVETLRAKNVAYKAQLQKNLDALAAQ